MYEVFLNDRKIILADTTELLSTDGMTGAEKILNPDALAAHLLRFLSNEELTMILQGEIDRLWSGFQKNFRLVPAAGGVVRNSRGILFIFRKGKWDLPKGKIDKGETPEAAAVREVMEETGLTRVQIVESLPSTFHIFLSPYKNLENEWILKETKWFSMSCPEDETIIPEKEEDIEEARWFAQESLDEILSNTYASLKKLVERLKSDSDNFGFRIADCGFI